MSCGASAYVKDVNTKQKNPGMVDPVSLQRNVHYIYIQLSKREEVDIMLYMYIHL